MAPKPRRKPAAHLLFIECHTRRLQEQSLAIGTPWHLRLSSLYPDKRIAIAAINTRSELAHRLGELVQGETRYRAVVIIAHSNHSGIKLTNEDFCNWTQLATWLEPLAPEHLILVACDAGRLTGVCSLFQSLPSLRTIYASPVPVAAQQAQFLDLLLAQLIASAALTSRCCDSPKWPRSSQPRRSFFSGSDQTVLPTRRSTVMSSALRRSS